jgi:hypothetical protein
MERVMGIEPTLAAWESRRYAHGDMSRLTATRQIKRFRVCADSDLPPFVGIDRA